MNGAQIFFGAAAMLYAYRYSSTQRDIANGVPIEYILPQHGEKYREVINSAADENGIPRQVLAALIQVESNFNPTARNKKSGAEGIAQFLPSTAKEWGVDTSDPISSINGAAKYLSWCTQFVGGNLRDGVMAYNWGPGNVKKYLAKQISTIPIETASYAVRVFDLPIQIGATV